MNNLAITLAMLYSSKIFQASRDMVTVYAIVAFMAAASVIGIMVFAYFDIKYGKPTSVEHGGSSINPHGGTISCKSFKLLNRKIIWLSVINIWFAQQVYFGFSAWITNLLTKRFAFELSESTAYQALLPISATIGIPLWSSLALKYGKKMTLMFCGYIIAIICFLSMYMMPLRKTIIVSVPLFFLGQFLAIQSSCTWSSVCLATPGEATPLALGLVQFGMAGIGALLAELFSKILEDQKHEEFDTALLIMAGFSFIGCIVSVLGYRED